MYLFLGDLKKFVFDILFPVYCILCEQEGIFLCSNCNDKLVKVIFQVCIVCQKQSLGGFTHPKCTSKYSPDRLISVFDYHDKRVSKLLITGKYYFLPELYKILGKQLAQYLKEEKTFQNFSDFCVTSIPLSTSRQRWRGFNQSQILGDEISNSLQIKQVNFLERKVNTKTQKDLNREARTQNIRGAFEVISKISVKNKRVLLIDDVTTTGVTFLEAAKILKQSGAKSVWCIAFAKD